MRKLLPAMASVVLISVILLYQSTALASRAGDDLLRKAYSTGRSARLSGITTTTLNENGRVVTASAKISRDGSRSRMEYLTGPSKGLIIVDDGRSVMRLVPAARTAYIQITPEPPDRLDLLLANYTALLESAARVAGRECHVLKVQPRYKGNPSQKLWVDKTSGAILRTESYASDGRLTSATRYDEVNLSAKPADALFRVPKGWKTVRMSADQGRAGLADVSKATGFKPVQPSYLPRGYAFDGYYLHKSPCGIPFVALRYTNGLNTISVFESNCRCKEMNCGAGRGRCRGGRGSCVLRQNSQGTLLQSRANGRIVTVVGDAAQPELEKVLQSIR